jgi:hypothetical protein
MEKYTNKFLYKILAVRGFESMQIFSIWESVHVECSEFMPVAMRPLRGFAEDSSKVLYLLPKNKMSAVKFPYIKKEILHILNYMHGFKEIKDIVLTQIS